MDTHRRRSVRFPLVFGVAALLWAAAALRPSETVLAQNGGTGSITGSVTADKGEVRAFRVNARDRQRGVRYSVYTSRAQYRFNAVPPGEYLVQVFEENYEGPVQTVIVAPGATARADIALKSVAPPPSTVELVDWDTLYPPSPIRQVLVDGCLGCHGPAAFHRRGGKTRAQWADLVNRMWTVSGIYAGVGSPMVSDHNVTQSQKEQIVDYLAANFGPNSPRRDVKKPALVRDEAALANALFVQYDLMPPDSDLSAPATSRRGTHDPFPSTSLKGTVWIASIASDEIMQVDTNPLLTFRQRTKAHQIPLMPGKKGVGPHGVVERNGKVYLSEIRQDHVGVLDIRSGRFDHIPALTPNGGMHTLRADSKGSIWYTQVGQGQIGRVDGATGKVTEWDPVPGSNYYGVVVDQQDRVWVNGLSKKTLVMWDPKTQAWKNFVVPNNARRLSIDTRGNVWFGEYFGNAITMLDPNNGRFTRHPMPMPSGNPYEGYIDKDANVWTDVDEYNSLVKFDTQTKQFTYYPYPDPRSHTPKVETDADGTVWFGYRSSLFAFRQNGNAGAPTTRRTR